MSCPSTAEVSPLFVTNALLRVKPEVTFRGDANFDHELNLTDAIAILETLFLGEELPCREAADFNEDGLLDISDPVAILNHLFLGGGGGVAEGGVLWRVGVRESNRRTLPS